MIKKEIKKHNFSPIEKQYPLTWEQAFSITGEMNADSMRSAASTITTTGLSTNTLTISPEFREVIREELIKLLEEERSR